MFLVSLAFAATPSITMGTDPDICLRGSDNPGVVCVQSDSWSLADAAGVERTYHWVSREPTAAESERGIRYRYGLADANGRILTPPVWDDFRVVGPELFVVGREGKDGAWETALIPVGGKPRFVPWSVLSPWALGAGSPDVHFAVLATDGDRMDVAALRPDGTLGPTLSGVTDVMKVGDIVAATVESPETKARASVLVDATGRAFWSGPEVIPLRVQRDARTGEAFEPQMAAFDLGPAPVTVDPLYPNLVRPITRDGAPAPLPPGVVGLLPIRGGVGDDRTHFHSWIDAWAYVAKVGDTYEIRVSNSPWLPTEEWEKLDRFTHVEWAGNFLTGRRVDGVWVAWAPLPHGSSWAHQPLYFPGEGVTAEAAIEDHRRQIRLERAEEAERRRLALEEDIRRSAPLIAQMEAREAEKRRRVAEAKEKLPGLIADAKARRYEPGYGKGRYALNVALEVIGEDPWVSQALEVCDDIDVNQVHRACGVSSQACEAATACRYGVEARIQAQVDQRMAWEAMWSGIAQGNGNDDVTVTVYEGGRPVNRVMKRSEYENLRFEE